MIDLSRFRKNEKSSVALLKFFIVILLFGLSFYFLTIEKIFFSYLLLATTLIVFFFSSKYDDFVFKTSFINLYFLFIGLVFLIGTYMLSSGFLFLFNNLDMIKYLLVISFTLGGITFIGVTQKDCEEEISKTLIISCFLLCSAGFCFLLVLAGSIAKEYNPINNSPLILYSSLKSFSMYGGLFGGILFSVGVFTLMYVLILKMNKIAFSSKTNKPLKEVLSNFFGLNKKLNSSEVKK